MRAVLTFAMVCTWSLPALADEQQEVTAALRKAIAARKHALPGEIGKAKQRLASATDAAKKDAAQQELTALEELQKKLGAPDGFVVPEAELPPKDRDWIGAVDSTEGELTVGAKQNDGRYVLMWRKTPSEKQVAILYRPKGTLPLGKPTSLQGVFRVVGKNSTGTYQWEIAEVSQTLIDGAEAEITGKSKTPEPSTLPPAP